MGSSDLKQLEQQAIPSKFRPPQLRKIMKRPRLLSIANPQTGQRLLSICAGPGFGKTTLMAQVFKYHSGPGIWYQIDSSDQDVAFFIKHLIVGVSQACKGIGGQAASHFVNSSDIKLDGRFILATLIEELKEKLDKPLVLCFDDFHLIEKSEYLDWIIQFMVDELPDTCNVCISSRTSANIPIAKLRAQGLVRDIGARDLQFSFEELKELLQKNWKIPIDETILAHLIKSTEGWAAGLVLAEENLRSGIEVPEIIAGNRIKRNVYKYLAEEALERQPGEIQTALEKCSLMDPIDPAIGETALECAGINATLAKAERLNLFTTRLDNSYLYRFHPMFREFLSDRLMERLGDAGICELRGRLGAAYEARNQKKEAISQYLASNQTGKAVGMIAEIGSEMLKAGEYSSLQRLLNSVPEHMQKKEFTIFQGQLLLAAGKLKKALNILRAIRKTLDISEKDLLYETTISIAKCLRLLGTSNEAAREIEPLTKMDYSPDCLMELLHHLNFCYWDCYDEIGMTNCVNEARKIVKKYPSADRISKVEVMLAWGNTRSGEFSGARRSLTDAIGIYGFSASSENMNLNNLASCLTMTGHYEKAKTYAEQCLKRIITQKEENWIHVLYDTYGCILYALGKTDSGKSYIQKSVDKVNELELGMSESCAALCHLGSISRREGQYVTARKYHEACLNAALPANSHYDIAVSKANIGADLVRLGNYEEAKSMLGDAYQMARQFKFKYALTQIEYHMAWAAHVRGDSQSEVSLLKSAIGRARQLQHNHFLIQEGRVTLPLLSSAINHQIQISYLFAIMEAMGEASLELIAPLIDGEDRELKISSVKLIASISCAKSLTLARKLAQEKDSELQQIARKTLTELQDKIGVIDKLLTKRETQVIALVAAGESNESIGKSLYISERTVKAHLTNIFKKLGLGTRVDAALYYQKMKKNNTFGDVKYD